MMNNYIKASVIIIFSLVFIACSSTSQQKSVVMETQTVISMPVLTNKEQQIYTQGIEQLKHKEYDLAEKTFRRLLLTHPRLAGAYVNLALIYDARKNQVKAMALYQEALKINPNNIAALIQSALMYQKEGKFKLAEKNLEKANGIDGNNEIVHYNLAVLYELYLQEYEPAIEHYQAYVNLSKNDDVAIVRRWIKLLETK